MDILKKLQGIDINLNECPKVKEYRLMYFIGVWFTFKRVFAEDDNEAIFDADNAEKTASDKLQYTLFCGNRKVKEYPAPTKPHVTLIKA